MGLKSSRKVETLNDTQKANNALKYFKFASSLLQVASSCLNYSKTKRNNRVCEKKKTWKRHGNLFNLMIDT